MDQVDYDDNQMDDAHDQQQHGDYQPEGEELPRGENDIDVDEEAVKDEAFQEEQ